MSTRPPTTGKGRVLLTVVGFALVAAACSPSADTPTTTTSGADATTTSAPTTTTQPPTTTTTEPEPTEYPPGVVWEQAVVDDGDDRRISALELTPSGWMITANASELTAGAAPTIYRSPDGLTWERIDLPFSTTAAVVNDVVYGPAGYVAVGLGAECNVAACPNSDGVVWLSIDGEKWEFVEPATLRGPNKVLPHAVRVIDDRYVMVGRDEQDGVDQVFKVWSSVDGRQWQLDAVLDDPEWAMKRFRGFVEWDGGYAITGSRAICRDPFRDDFYGWVYALTGAESKAWTSTDGAVWEELDLAGAGLIDAQDDETCDINEWASDESIAAANGVFESIGGRLFWVLGTGEMFEADPETGTWGPTDRTVAPSVANATATAGTVMDDFGFVSVGLNRVVDEKLDVAMERSDDLITWLNWTDETTSFDPVGERIQATFISTDGEWLLVVYQGQTSTASITTPITALVSATAPIPPD